jgi:hypothetical protein
MISIRSHVPYSPGKPAKKLSHIGAIQALRLFRSGLDTVAIAANLECTEAAAANGLAHARDAERASHG